MPQLEQEATQCQATGSTWCRIPNYETLQEFNNSLGHKNVAEAAADLSKFGFLFTQQCQEYIQPFLCALYLPVCIASPREVAGVVPDLVLPCAEECTRAKKHCEHLFQKSHPIRSWPAEWDCDNFPSNNGKTICFIKQRNETTPSQLPSQPYSPASNNTICHEDMFDCQLVDPANNQRRAICVASNLVCDGKKDCTLGVGEIPGEGLDEMNCKPRCFDDQLFCDDRCIGRADICNGIVDCSSGLDELDCYDYTTGLIQSILCIFALFSAIYLLVRFFRVDDEVDEPHPYVPPFKASDMQPQPQHQRFCHTHHTMPRFNNLKKIINDDSHFMSDSQSNPNAIYEPAYEDSCYERVNSGGYSGLSSIYDSSYAYPFNQSIKNDDPNEPPAPPPPTPVKLYYRTESNYDRHESE